MPLDNRRQKFRSSLLCLVSSIVAGCTVGPDYHRPKTSVPGAFIGATTAPSTQQSVANQEHMDLARWWKGFNDPMLDSLVHRAIQSNLDLRIAEARLREARASRGVVSAGLFPSANAVGSYTRSRGPRGDLYTAGFDASWEIDVFGGIRRDIEAADADVRAQVEDLRDVLITLASEVAVNYIDLQGFRREIEIARQNITSQQQSADLTRKKFRGGVVSGLDVANAEAEVASTASQIPLLESRAQQTIYTLSLLLGGEPGALDEELSATAPIPAVPPVIQVGLPSELLRRRPDIRRVEAQLHGATARIGVATADLFPRFTLNGRMGTQGSKVATLGNWDNRFWSIGPGATWNIFDAGRTRSNIEVQKAREEQSFILYRKTVLTALGDVESSLIAYEKEQQHWRALTDAAAANHRAVDIATRLYQQGQTDFLNVLSAQRALFASEDALVQSQRTVATNLVAIYKSLGGGWEASAPTTQPTRHGAIPD